MNKMRKIRNTRNRRNRRKKRILRKTRKGGSTTVVAGPHGVMGLNAFQAIQDRLSQEPY